MTDHDTPKTLPDWGLEPPQWIDEPAPAPAAADVDPGGETDPDPEEHLTWRSEANNPWSLDDDEEMPPPVVGGGDEGEGG